LLFGDEMDDPTANRDKYLAEIAAARSPEELEEIRIGLLGRSGAITAAMRGLGGLPPEQRRAAGAGLNTLRDAIAAAIAEAGERLGRAALANRLAGERADVTLPMQTGETGRIHPISQTIDEIVAIFGEMGFVVAEGPHIEEDFYNFTALNIPPEHPARQEHDTFYLPPRADGSRLVLRTHTSPVQIRTMLAQKPPLRIIVPGRTFRADHDATHSPMFHQVEGLVVDRTTHMGHLKGCLIEFCRAFFGVDDLPVRFRPSYFPFTEPSAEVDIGCSRQGGELKIGAGGDWLEILGSGMVHPKVLANCGIDPAEYQGFAFGMGIERVAMLKYGIPDLRTMYDSDLRWLRHYGFVPLDIPSPVRGALS
jgi:phenylalanyl-tRNA synthetase alpha chain